MTQKTAAGLLGIAAVGGGGIAIANPEWMGIVSETPWKPLSQDSDFESGGYGNKFGGNHKNYLVGTSSENKAWWEEKAKNIKSEEKKGKFQKVQQGFDGTDSLKDLCNEAYKKSGTDLKSEEPGTDEFKKSDVWKYCSVLGKGPSVVKVHDRKETSGKKYESSDTSKPFIGAKEESSLISVNDEQNSKFWDLRNQEFCGKGLFKKTGNITVETGHAFFKEAKNKNQETIKDICAKAYGMDSTNTTSTKDAPTTAEVKKYCSLK